MDAPLFEDLVVEKMKPKVQEKTTKFQIGGMKGHRSTEHLFSVKHVLAYYAMIQQPIIIYLFIYLKQKQPKKQTRFSDWAQECARKTSGRPPKLDTAHSAAHTRAN